MYPFKAFVEKYVLKWQPGSHSIDRKGNESTGGVSLVNLNYAHFKLQAFPFRAGWQFSLPAVYDPP